MLQLKNAGGMRLIRNKEVAREILKYDLQGKKLVNQQRYYENYQNKTISLGLKIFSLQPFQIIESTSQLSESLIFKKPENPLFLLCK